MKKHLSIQNFLRLLKVIIFTLFYFLTLELIIMMVSFTQKLKKKFTGHK